MVKVQKKLTFREVVDITMFFREANQAQKVRDSQAHMRAPIEDRIKGKNPFRD